MSGRFFLILFLCTQKSPSSVHFCIGGVGWRGHSLSNPPLTPQWQPRLQALTISHPCTSVCQVISFSSPSAARTLCNSPWERAGRWVHTIFDDEVAWNIKTSYLAFKNVSFFSPSSVAVFLSLLHQGWMWLRSLML